MIYVYREVVGVKFPLSLFPYPFSMYVCVDVCVHLSEQKIYYKNTDYSIVIENMLESENTA